MRKKMFFTMTVLIMLMSGCNYNEAEVTEGNSISIREEITVQEDMNVGQATSVEQAANAEQTADIILCNDIQLWEHIERERAYGGEFPICEVIIDGIRHKAVYHETGILIVDNICSDLKEDTYTVYYRDKKLVVPAEYSLGYEWLEIGFKEIGEAKRECLFIGGHPSTMPLASFIDMENFELIKNDYEVKEIEKGLSCTIKNIEAAESGNDNFNKLKAEIQIEDNYGNVANVTADNVIFDDRLNTDDLESYEWDVVFVPNVTRYVDTDTMKGSVSLYLAYKDKQDKTAEYVLEKSPNIELSFEMKYDDNSNRYEALFGNVMIEWQDEERSLKYYEVVCINDSEEEGNNISFDNFFKDMDARLLLEPMELSAYDEHTRKQTFSYKNESHNVSLEYQLGLIAKLNIDGYEMELQFTKLLSDGCTPDIAFADVNNDGIDDVILRWIKFRGIDGIIILSNENGYVELLNVSGIKARFMNYSAEYLDNYKVSVMCDEYDVDGIFNLSDSAIWYLNAAEWVYDEGGVVIEGNEIDKNIVGDMSVEYYQKDNEIFVCHRYHFLEGSTWLGVCNTLVYKVTENGYECVGFFVDEDDMQGW